LCTRPILNAHLRKETSIWNWNLAATANMPPVPVYTESPITATKASGVTPQTATSNDGLDADNPTPTSSTQAPRYVPAGQPTSTRTAPEDGPPAPQPGAVPYLPTATQGTPSRTNYQPPEPTAAPQYPAQPPQMGVPAPSMTYGQRGTATATASHPPGYQQNTASSGLNSYQSTHNESLGHDREEGVWGSALKWAQAAGKKLSDAETEVWRRINKE